MVRRGSRPGPLTRSARTGGSRRQPAREETTTGTTDRRAEETPPLLFSSQSPTHPVRVRSQVRSLVALGRSKRDSGHGTGKDRGLSMQIVARACGGHVAPFCTALAVGALLTSQTGAAPLGWAPTGSKSIFKPCRANGSTARAPASS